jgi:hypothetical protein
MSFPSFADLAWQVNDLLRQPGARQRFLLQCFKYLKDRRANPGPGSGLPLDGPMTLAAKYAVLAALHTAVCFTEEPINPAPWQGLWYRSPAWSHVGMWQDLKVRAGAPLDSGEYRLELCQLRGQDRPALESFLRDVAEDLRHHLSNDGCTAHAVSDSLTEEIRDNCPQREVALSEETDEDSGQGERQAEGIDAARAQATARDSEGDGRGARPQAAEGDGTGRDQEEAEANGVDLNEREREVLRALLLLSATGQRRAVSRDTAARKVDPACKPGSYYKAVASLVTKGLVNRQLGPGGGIWLTPKGEFTAKTPTTP